MGGSTTTNQTSQSQSVNEIPQWVQNAGQQNYALAQQVATQPLDQYQGQMVAGVSPQMQQAFDLAANSGGVGQGALNGAQAALLTGANYTPNQITAPSDATIKSFMNPYTTEVIDKTLPIMQQGLALSQDQQQNAASSANAYGGSRQAIQQGVTQAQGAQNQAQMAAQLNQAGYTQALTAAQQAAMANQAAGLTANGQKIAAGGALGTLGGEQMQNNIAQFGMLTGAGGLEEQQQQNQINAQIAKFQQAWQYPQQQLGIMESSLGMTPYNTGTSGSSATTTEQQQSNPMSAALGGMNMLGSLFGPMLMASRGLTKVPGRRASSRYEVDNVPAMLAPGEAVLNRHAAARLGRGKIAALNSLGSQSLPPSSPGVARAIGMLAPSGAPGRLSPFATPPSRSMQRRRVPIQGALSG